MDKLQKAIPGEIQTINYDEKITLTARCLKYRFDFGGIKTSTVNITMNEIRQNVLKQLNIPETFKDVSFANFDTKDNKVPFYRIKKAVDEDLIGKTSMIFWSKDLYGVGKTHLLYAMAKEYALSDKRFNVERSGKEGVLVDYVGSSICVLSEYDFINQIKDTFKPNSEKTEGDVFARLNKFDVLCLDDVVKYTPVNLEFYHRIMFQLIDERYKNKKSIIITTNKTLGQLGECIGVATADRLYEMTKGFQLEFKGESHRSKQGN